MINHEIWCYPYFQTDPHRVVIVHFQRMAVDRKLLDDNQWTVTKMMVNYY